MNEVDELLDLADLDLLDEEVHHARCTHCYGQIRAYDRFVALCGTLTIMRNLTGQSPPPSACEECKRLYHSVPCRICGRISA